MIAPERDSDRLLDRTLRQNSTAAYLDIVVTHVPEGWRDYRRAVKVLAHCLDPSGLAEGRRRADEMLQRRPTAVLRRVLPEAAEEMARRLLRCGATVAVQAASPSATPAAASEPLKRR
ncbi:hypothetical protein [Salininema proteolyticum]|uniref:Ribosomal protein L7/L12 C-terminal domain-containing protein n=1 Tax=Salininema proteolyticum TaxID=1607685 RepID=A0ABV8U0K3_9ACTN